MVARSDPWGLNLPTRGFHVVIDSRVRRRRIGGWVALTFTLAALFFVMIPTRIALDRNAFILEDIRGQIDVEQDRYRDLRLQLAELRSPERISGAAEDLGMVYPERIESIEVPGLGTHQTGGDPGWADLKTLLSAQP